MLVAAHAPHARASGIGERSPLEFDEVRSVAEFDEEAPGVRAGNFNVRPAAALSMAHDSNLFAKSGPHDDDSLSIAEAQVRAENEAGVVDVAARAFARARRYLHASDQDTTEFGGSAALSAEPTANDTWSAHLVAQRRFESRTDIETPDIAAVSFYREWRGDLRYSHEFSRFTLSSAMSARRIEYEQASQEFRDLATYGGEIGGSYELRNGVSLIASSYYSRDDYRSESPLVASAETVGALAGVRVNIPEIAEVELAGGHFRRTFAQQPGAISGLSARGSVTLHPTRLTRVRADLVREDQPTAVAGALGKVRTVSSVAVDHSYSRNFALYARGSLISDAFDGAQPSARTWLTEAGGAWLYSRRYLVAVEYDYASRNAPTAPDSGFVRNMVSVTFVGRY
jgi:hypothetical protein